MLSDEQYTESLQFCKSVNIIKMFVKAYSILDSKIEFHFVFRHSWVPIMFLVCFKDLQCCESRLRARQFDFTGKCFCYGEIHIFLDIIFLPWD